MLKAPAKRLMACGKAKVHAEDSMAPVQGLGLQIMPPRSQLGHFRQACLIYTFGSAPFDRCDFSNATLKASMRASSH